MSSYRAEDDSVCLEFCAAAERHRADRFVERRELLGRVGLRVPFSTQLLSPTSTRLSIRRPSLEVAPTTLAPTTRHTINQ